MSTASMTEGRTTTSDGRPLHPCENHSYDCHCGKRAKLHHIAHDGSCGNVCGTHGNAARRRGDEVTEGTPEICDICGAHCFAGVTKFSLLRGSRTRYCRPCELAEREAERAAR